MYQIWLGRFIFANFETELASLSYCLHFACLCSLSLLLGARLIVVGRRLGIAPLNAASFLVDDLFSGLLAESILSRRRFFLAFSTMFLALSELIGHFKRRLGGMTRSPLHRKLNTK